MFWHFLVIATLSAALFASDAPRYDYSQGHSACVEGIFGIVAAPAPDSDRAVVTQPEKPLAGYSFYANSDYSSKVIHTAVPQFQREGKHDLARQAARVASVPTFLWMSSRDSIQKLRPFAEEAQHLVRSGAKLLLPLVIYNLPDRDCGAKASSGELRIADNGVDLYKTSFVDPIAATIKQFPELKFVLVIGTLGNLVSNINKTKCRNALEAHKESVSYALRTFDFPNVYTYVDGGNSGWWGFTMNMGPAAKLVGEVWRRAGRPRSFRGLATNTANYNAWSVTQCANYTQGSRNCDEKRYINAIAPLLRQEGTPAHFITDMGRSGVQPTGQWVWGDWCNALNTGFGLRPSTHTDDPLLDAWVWIKPGGESDGTSSVMAERFDPKCGQADAKQPAPEAGQWFQEYFEQLLRNANPPF
ncbi:glycosyl hydrolases family 6 protein [Phyllosticta citricarpa]|uniref:Glucanase n=1 Tax=Phyllosticta citricarpa TaxID=55181 RepID=A0ABR1ML17_9PEZI